MKLSTEFASTAEYLFSKRIKLHQRERNSLINDLVMDVIFIFLLRLYEHIQS